METKLEEAKKSLDEFFDSRKETDEESIEKAKGYLGWVSLKTDVIKDEKSFTIPDEHKDKIKRGNVFWVHFGFNIDQEFGGKHPAIILKTSPNMIVVAPLSSQEPSEEQKKSGIYVEVDKVGGFKPLEGGKSRWVNLLDIRSISVQRIDFNSTTGYVKGYILDKINLGMNRLWRVFTPKNSGKTP
jgi:mRNA-degrading endonuclease toxin of MazEF toxin-antitoxin module